MFDVTPTKEEIRFDESDIIVSKTDQSGRITYANDVFCHVAEVSLADVLGEPHSCIRHPDMPRAVFYLLWDEIQNGREIFAYVKNMSRSGKYYWVYAHVTPSFDLSGKIIGFHSNRRVPNRMALETIVPMYQELRAIETEAGNKKDLMERSIEHLYKTLDARGQTYDEFVWSLENSHV